MNANYVTGDAAFAVDRDGVIVLWNAAAAEAFGCPASSALGQHCWKLLCGRDTYGNDYCRKSCPLREMAFQNKSVNGFKAVYKTRHHGRQCFSISCLTVFDDHGQEWLLHICRADSQIPDGNDESSRFQSFGNEPFCSLTRREQEVLALLAAGKDNQEIASAMCISVLTVRNHIQHMMSKLGVHSRLEAVLLALEQPFGASSKANPAEDTADGRQPRLAGV